MAPRYLWIGLVTLLAANAAACGDNTSTTSAADTLAIYYPKDRAEVFSLVVDYNYSHENVTIDEEKTQVSNLRLYIRRLSIEGTNNWKPLEIPFSKHWDFQGISAPSLWNKGYIPKSDYILPTGEFFNSTSSGLCCIVFDGTFRLFELDPTKGVFVEKQPTDDLTAELRKWYSSSFKVDDVYWSYGLVTHPEFFGDLPPIDVVQMSDGSLVTVDNTRLLAAKLTDTPVQATVRGFDEAFPIERDPYNQFFSNPATGTQPTTWGDAILNRTASQPARNPLWQRWYQLYPQGAPITGFPGGVKIP